MKVDKQPVLDTDEVLKTVYQLMSLDLVYLNGIVPQSWDRSFSYKTEKWSDPYVFKAKYQLNTLFKRYITKEELGNVEKNRLKAYASFIGTQERLGKASLFQKSSTQIVLQKARGKIKKLLGKFDETTHNQFCRFGRRAAVGLNYRESYLDKRVSTLTGSQDHIRWFHQEILPQDDLLRRSCTSTYAVCGTLTLSDVDKSWDKRRTILKNTVLGGFYTAGVGDYMVSMLKLDGINLSRVPERHRFVIKEYSRNLRYVTADLSAASDSFTSELMCKLFPRDWYNAMKRGRISQVSIAGKTYATTSFMTMGIGFTFPAQTIAFRFILEAIRDLLNVQGKVSAFGDDLIYPTQMHPYVVSVLNDCGFILNDDKTFVTTPFRESCGADFYDGIDVRPFQPEGSHEVLHGLSRLSYLYKMYNGLKKRWLELELPRVFSYLLGQMLLCTEQVHQVPEDFPVTSGIQTRDIRYDHRFLRPKRSIHGDYTFLSLSHKGRLREVPIQTPYLWEFLRQKSRMGSVDDYSDHYLDPTDSLLLQWVKRRTRQSRQGKPPIWVVRLIPHVSEKGAQPCVIESCNVSCSFAGTEVGP